MSMLLTNGFDSPHLFKTGQVVKWMRLTGETRSLWNPPHACMHDYWILSIRREITDIYIPYTNAYTQTHTLRLDFDITLVKHQVLARNSLPYIRYILGHSLEMSRRIVGFGDVNLILYLEPMMPTLPKLSFRKTK